MEHFRDEIPFDKAFMNLNFPLLIR